MFEPQINMNDARWCLHNLRRAVRRCRRGNPVWKADIAASNRHWHRSGLETLEMRSSVD